MVQHAADIYGSQGSVPFDPSGAEHPTGLNAPNMSNRATPEDMGAAIGAGVSKIGAVAEELTQKYGGMVNDTLANNAESSLAQQIGKIKGDYMSKTGMDAYNSYGAYQAAIEQAYQENSKGLTIGAGQAYMMQSRRMVDNHLADGGSYAASQLKDARVYSDTQLQSVPIKSALEPDTALSPRRMGEAEGTLHHLVGAAIDPDHPGLKTDPDTGVVGFDESKPEGQQLKAQYQQNLDTAISQLKINQFSTLARPDVMGAPAAYDLFKQVRDSLPPQAQVGIESYLKPRVFQTEVSDSTNSVINEAKQAHAQMLYNPQPLSVRNNNPGNLRDSSTGQFRVFDTPEAGQAAMQADLTAKISGNSPAMEKNFGKGYSPTLSNVITTYAPPTENNTKAYIDTVSKATGIAPDQILKTNDLAKLMPAMASVEAGGSSSLAPVQGKIETAGYSTTQPAPKYGTNANGAPLSEADYYQAHSGDVLARWHQISNEKWPGDLAHEKAGDATLRQYMQTTIANQAGQERQNKQTLLSAVLGDGQNAKPITSIDQLRADPKLRDLYSDVFSRDPKAIETLNGIITKNSKGDENTNSPNGYDAILATLGTDDPHPYSRQERIEYLSKGLGSENPGYSISKKDFNDAKPAVDLTDGRSQISVNMKAIAQANGNLDGKGQERAVQWYNQTMAAWKANQAKEGSNKMDEATFFDQDKGGMPPAPMPSRIEQLHTAQAKTQPAPAVFSDKSQYDAAPSGTIFINNGKQYRKP